MFAVDQGSNIVESQSVKQLGNEKTEGIVMLAYVR